MARTDALTALSIEFAAELVKALQDLDAADDVRAVVLASKARIFCAGLDLKALTSVPLGTAKGNLEFPSSLRSLFDCCDLLEKCRKPVIAAVHGGCIGGGLDIAAACDIRLCTEDAFFSLREAAIGLVADMGVLQRLPAVIGQGFTREMAFTAADYAAREAEKMGLVRAVYPDRDTLYAEAGKLAGRIAANAPLAVQATKEVLNASRGMSVEDGMSLAMHKNMVLFPSRDFKEAIRAFGEKRRPEFKGE
jgi:enoyl-CoA hydratase